MPYPDHRATLMETLELLDQNLYIRILRSSYTVLTPEGWILDYKADPFWRLYVNDQDGAFVHTKDGPVALRPGWLYIIPAHLIIGLTCSSTLNHFYAHFDVLGLPDIALRQLFTGPFGLPCEPHVERAIQISIAELLARKPHASRQVGAATQCWIKSIIYGAIAEHLQTVPLEQIDYCWHLAQRMELVRSAVTYIEAHLSEELSNGLLARECGMSEGHFIRTFRDCMGQTPSQYVIECRVKAASQRLLLTSDSIDQIANECGFGTRDYFSRIFARQTGLPPAAFRLSLYGDGGDAVPNQGRKKRQE